MSGGQVQLTREEIAQRDIGHTDISRGLSWLMTAAFLITLFVPPSVQLVYDLGRGRDDANNEARSSASAIVQTLPAVAYAFYHADGGFVSRLLAANRQLLRNIGDYERQLEERSLLTRRLLGPTQAWLTRFGGIGNERAFVGNDGWLFYRTDVEYLTGPGFLEPAELSRRSRSRSAGAAPPQPDPRRAIVEFHKQLAGQGIRLILMPTPGKAMILPEKLSPRCRDSSVPLQNESFSQFKNELEAAGILLFDPAPAMAEQEHGRSRTPQFLRTDTHWTPTGVQSVAQLLHEFIERHALLPAREATGYRQQSLEVTNLGDIAAMLHLPSMQTLFPPETVSLRQIVQPDDRVWQPDESADTLLIGDSFSNIYSLPGMNWGTAAGLAEQLSFLMQRPVDRLAQNDGGAFATRQSLFQELARGHNRLAGKRLVIWQFAARELATGDWKQLPLPHVPADGDNGPEDANSTAAEEVVVRGTIRSAAGTPQPGTVPYRDAVTGLHLVEIEVLRGSVSSSEAVVYLWGMRDNQLTKGARLAPGQKVTLRLIPWDTVRGRYDRWNRIELDDPEFHLVDLPIYWGEVVP